MIDREVCIFFFDNLYTQYPSHLIGGGLGVLMGLFFGALDNPIMAEEMTARQQIVYTAKQMGRRSISNAKTFAVMGLIFSAAECVVEKVDNCNVFCIHECLNTFSSYLNFVFSCFGRLGQSMTLPILRLLVVSQVEL